jgi:hypothetical protein
MFICWWDEISTTVDYNFQVIAKRACFMRKLKVMGRIDGQIIQVIYALLKQDAETVSQVPAGQPLPPPRLYDPKYIISIAMATQLL